MKSLVLLTFISLSSNSPATVGKAEYFDNEQACQVRMQELRERHPVPGKARCICHKTTEEVTAEGNDAI